MVGEFIKNSEIINQTFTCEYINLSTSATIKEIGKGGVSKWFRYLAIIGRTFKQLIKFKPDLVYLTLTTTGNGFYKDALVALLVKLFKVPLVYHFHNKGIKTRQKKWFDNQLYKRVLKNVDIILLSKYLYYDIKKYVSKNRVYYCPNGTVSLLKEFDLEPNYKTTETTNILFLSNLIKSKGVFVLVDACKLLKDYGLSFNCIFVGGVGDIKIDEFDHIVSHLDLTENIHYAGRKYGHDKALAYLNADIFVLPTMYRNECFPLVLLEAMECGLPVISTREGGIPEIVESGKTGFLIEKQSPKKMADKLAELIEDPPLCVSLGKMGRSRYLDNFTKEHFERHFTITLQEILKK